MDIIPEPFDREEQDKALVTALTAIEATSLYLDTSALVWLYRIRPQARAEFVNFLEAEPLCERSHIPMWSLHELNKHRKSPKVLFPLLDQHAKLSNAIDLIQATAHLFVDDKFAGGTAWGTQKSYIEALTKASEELLKVTKPLNKAGEIIQIDAELAPFLKAHALEQPLPALAPLRDEFVARREGRLPPGFEDLAKGGASAEATGYAGANRFGDFVFWRSLIDHARKDETIKTVVIVSHDAKRDWIHVPSQYVGYGQKVAGNNSKGGQYTRPHPILSFEIKVEAGVERLFIVSIMQLVSAFSLQGAGVGFKELARAIQIEVAEAEEPTEPAVPDADETQVEAELAGEVEALGPDGEAPVIAEAPGEPTKGANDHGMEPALPLPAQGVAARLAALPDAALADRNYAGDPAGNPKTDEVIAALRSHNWYTQNPAVRRLAAAVVDPATSDLQRFVLGRNLYQAACGNAWRAADFLTTLGAQEAHFGGGNFAIVFAGALFEAYYDPDGNLRPRLKDQMLDALFALAANPEFEDVTAWIRDRLAPSAAHFVLYPGGPRDEAVFEVTLDAQGRPAQIHVAGTLITEPTQLNDDGWDPEALPAKGTTERMTKVFANVFDLPTSRVRIEPPIADELNFARLKLRPWSTDAALIFPGN